VVYHNEASEVFQVLSIVALLIVVGFDHNSKINNRSISFPNESA
jgi:hypothetical protein